MALSLSRFAAMGLMVAAVVAPAAADEAPVLADGTVWNLHFTHRPEPFVDAQGKAAAEHSRAVHESAFPQADWMKPDVDDSDWWRGRLPVHPEHGFRQPRSLALLCARGSFGIEADVADVAPLRLSIAYRGGIVVYLNGREVARRHLPDGELAMDAAAQGYPREAYMNPDDRGRIGPRGEHHDSDEIRRRLGLRIRRLESLTLPAELLQRGRNVLAIEVHRAPSLAGLPDYAGDRALWSKLGLLEVSLTAESLRGIRANVAPPRGLQVWNANPLAPIGEAVDYGDPFAPLRPLRLVAARNGSASGQVVVSSRHGLRGDSGVTGARVQASCSGLKGPGGATIDAGQIRLSFAHRPVRPDWEGGSVEPVGYFDILSPEADAAATVHPVWVTVAAGPHVPAGTYRGSLRIQPGVQDAVEVPVELTVCEAVLPDPRDYRSHAGLLQSPESIAAKYNVEPWSPRHWQLIEASLKLLGQIGNDVVYVTAIRETHLGNEHAMLRFREGRGGQLEPDLSLVERYLTLWKKHVGPPAALVVYVWEPNMYSRGRRADAVDITVVEDGRPVADELPMYGDRGSREPWKAAMDGVYAIANRLGLEPGSVMLGCGADSRPHEKTVEFFTSIAPKARWALFTHGRGDPPVRDGVLTIGSLRVGYYEGPDKPRLRLPLQGRLIGGWDAPLLKAVSLRGMVTAYSPPASYRCAMDAAVADDSRGLARYGLDFWQMQGTADMRGGSSLITRYGTNGTLDINLMRDNPRAIAAAGVDGALPTVRLEMLREGVQETEARIVIEQALARADAEAVLGPDLAGRCRALLAERLAANLLGRDDWAWFASSGWQQRTRALYDLAGQVQGRIKGTP